jgi:hypothetical protein
MTMFEKKYLGVICLPLIVFLVTSCGFGQTGPAPQPGAVFSGDLTQISTGKNTSANGGEIQFTISEDGEAIASLAYSLVGDKCWDETQSITAQGVGAKISRNPPPPIILTTLILLACGLFSAPTKTSANPLLTLLAGIPQDPISASKGEIYFMDAAAMEAAYNITRPPNAEVFMNEEYAAWWVVGRETLGLLGETLFQMETMPEMTGFSPLEIDQAIQFSAPPSQGLIFMGKFDADAIEDAFEKNLDFKPNDFNGTTLWCWIEGCENGMQIDPGNALRENPFGGRLGQRQPMIISSDLLMASPDLDLVLAHVSARKGKLSSLADDPAYHAAANAVSKDAYVLQAMIVNRTRLQQMVNNPPYDLLVMADVVAKDEQITRLGLVYRDIDSPEMVASALLERLASRQSAQFKRRFAELLTARNVTSPRHFIYQEADRTVVVLEFPTRKATLDELAQMVNIITYEGNATPPGLVYRLFFQTFGMEDIGWLSPAGDSLTCDGGTFSQFRLKNINQRNYTSMGQTCTLAPQADGVIWIARGEGYAMSNAGDRLVFKDGQGREFGHVCWVNAGTIAGVTHNGNSFFLVPQTARVSAFAVMTTASDAVIVPDF